jgi:hypothetical protein
MKFIFENKKLFLDNISNMCSLALCFFLILFYSINLICVSISIISIIVYLNKLINLINKFIKHIKVNIPSFYIKYLDFQVLFLNIINDILFIYSYI